MMLRTLFIPLIFLQALLFSQIHVDHYKDQLLEKRTHTELINYLVKKNNYKSFLEIGVMFRWCNIDLIDCPNKIGVDPAPQARADFVCTSDAFFKKNKKKFDIIFIDGLHLYEQTLRDIENSIKCLNPGGTIVMHDCLPTSRSMTARKQCVGPWTGDVWKAAAYVRMNYDHVKLCVLDMDWGCGVLKIEHEPNLFAKTPLHLLDWNFFVSNRNQLMNVASVEDWINSP